MPNQPRTPAHNFRCDGDLYAAAKAAAAARDETLTHVITEALKRYVARNATKETQP